MARKWYHIATGNSLDSLNSFVADHQLAAGDHVVVEMKLTGPFAQFFDLAPDWWPNTPDGMQVVDIWGEGWPVPWSDNYGYVQMEANSPQLWALLAFVRTRWLLVSIAGFALYSIVGSCNAYLFTDYGSTPPVNPVPPTPPNGNGSTNILDTMLPMMIMVMMMNMMSGVMEDVV